MEAGAGDRGFFFSLIIFAEKPNRDDGLNRLIYITSWTTESVYLAVWLSRHPTVALSYLFGLFYLFIIDDISVSKNPLFQTPTEEDLALDGRWWLVNLDLFTEMQKITNVKVARGRDQDWIIVTFVSLKSLQWKESLLNTVNRFRTLAFGRWLVIWCFSAS